MLVYIDSEAPNLIFLSATIVCQMLLNIHHLSTSAAFRQYLCRTLFLVCLKILILSHKPFPMGVQPNPTKHSVVVIVRAILTNSLRKNKYYMKDITFIRFIPVIHADNPEHTLSFSGGRLCPRQVYSRVTSDSDM